MTCTSAAISTCRVPNQPCTGRGSGSTSHSSFSPWSREGGGTGEDDVRTRAGASPGMRRPSLLIYGWYGNGNVGDEALLDGLVSEIRRIAPAARVTVVSDAPAQTSRRLGVDSVRRGDDRMARARLVRAMLSHDVFALGG